jgi:lipoprotein NlpI
MQLIITITALCLFAATPGVAAEKESFDGLQFQARAAYAKGKPQEAVMLATQAIAVAPRNPRGYALRASLHAESREPGKAIADYDQAIQLDPLQPDAWQHRGGEHFKLGHIKESLADFDRFIELEPAQAPYHWQRGISLYYAERFEEGRKQFELHQTVNPDDVENAVWHFLCVARAAGVENARAALISIKNDPRVPMMEVHALFANKLKPEDVLKAAAADNPPPLRLNRQLFYAHLYLGLYFEVLGDDQQACEHITQAAGRYRTDDYMGAVARVHRQLRWRKMNFPPTGTSRFDANKIPITAVRSDL